MKQIELYSSEKNGKLTISSSYFSGAESGKFVRLEPDQGMDITNGSEVYPDITCKLESATNFYEIKKTIEEETI